MKIACWTIFRSLVSPDFQNRRMDATLNAPAMDIRPKLTQRGNKNQENTNVYHDFKTSSDYQFKNPKTIMKRNMTLIARHVTDLGDISPNPTVDITVMT